MDCVMLVVVDVDELQHALGGIVLEAAYLERVLRTAFSALVGSKYAAVVDGRLTAAALIEDCERITRYHTGIAKPAKEAVSALRACHEANKNRNRVIHDTWATRPGSVMVTLQGRPGPLTSSSAGRLPFSASPRQRPLVCKMRLRCRNKSSTLRSVLVGV
jgi:hypothetical protein